MFTASPDLPEPAAGIETAALMGAWYILVTNYRFWRRRSHPRIEYRPLPPDDEGRARFCDRLDFRRRDWLGRPRPRTLLGIDRVERDGEYRWQGQGATQLIVSRWCVPLVDRRYRWAVTYFARSNIGTAPGLDIYSRDPVLEPDTLAAILAAVRAHAFLGPRCAGLFAPSQHWTPPQPYQLGD